MSSRHVFKTSWRCLQRNNFSSSKTSSRRLENVLEDVKLLRWRRVEDVFKTCLEDVFKTSSRPTNVCREWSCPSNVWSIFSSKISFFSICLHVVTRSQTLKNDVFSFRNLDPYKSRLYSQEKWWFVAGICLIWKLMEYTNDHSPDASIIILTF